MASTYSQLKIELIGLGEQDGTWGTTTNTNLGVAIDEAIAGRANPVMGNSNLTLALVDSNASQVARHYILNVTSAVTLTATRDLIVPAINKPYIIENNTTGTQSIVVKTASGTGVTVPNGKRMMVFVNGTNVVTAFNELPAGTTITGQGDVVTTTGTQTLTNKTLTTPSLTGTPTAPTASAGTNTTQVATTAFSSTAITNERTAVATLTNKSLTSPILTGTPTAPTAAPGTSTTQLATTAFVQNVAGSLGTMSTQNANTVSITGGAITGTTVNSVVVGTNARGARTVSTATPTGGVDGDVWYQF